MRFYFYIKKWILDKIIFIKWDLVAMFPLEIISSYPFLYYELFKERITIVGESIFRDLFSPILLHGKTK